MLVSVIITTFNSAEFIERSLTSVLEQTYKNIEIIIVDDNSKDNTLDILKKYEDQINVIKKEKNLGPANSRNLGLKSCNGDLVCFLDADDYWKKKKINEQVKYAKQYPDINIFSNNVLSINKNKIISKRFSSEKIFKNKYQTSGIVLNYIRESGRYSFHPPSVIMIRKKVFTDHGMYNENLKSVEDSELILRWIISGEKIYYNDEALAFYEVSNQESLTKNLTLWSQNHFKYWFSFNFSNLNDITKKKLIKMRKNTLLQSIFVLLKRGEISLARKYLFSFYLNLIGIKWILLMIMSLFPIKYFIRLYKKILKLK